MGKVPTASTTETPPEPETVKYTEAEVAKARSNAKATAAQKYGISGTNTTRGMLTDDTIESKKKLLGGE